MTDLRFWTGLLAVIMTLPIIVAYARIVLKLAGTAQYIAISFLLFAISASARIAYWEILPRIVPARAWAIWGGLMSGSQTVIFFHVLVAAAGFVGVLALHGMIPDDERPNYRLWNSWRYPPWRLGVWLRSIIRGDAQ